MNTTKTVKYTPDILDPYSGTIIGSAIEVHRTLGPGLLESAYQRLYFTLLLEKQIDTLEQ